MADSVQSKVSIVGAGLSGTVMAVYLARRGFEVDVFEKRSDPRGNRVSAGRSVNMTLAARGLHALGRVIDLSEILDLTVPLEGRMVHGIDGSTGFSPYGIDKSQVLHAVMRSMLNARLLDIAERYPNIKVHFEYRCGEIDPRTSSLQVINEATNEPTILNPKFIVGADGTFSTVRSQIHRNERANFQQEYLESGYREFIIPPAPDGGFRMYKNALHIWPRGRCLFLAIPNIDGSFACNCILPFVGEDSFATLTTPSAVTEFFERNFPDVLGLVAGLPHSFLPHPPAPFITTRSRPWHCGGRVVLIGDACHTVVPFYGQGMNAALEDCAALDDCIARHGDNLDTAFNEFQDTRKPHTDALADLSIQNFLELRDKVRSPILRARKTVNLKLHRAFPRIVIPLYTLISHSIVPYADAIERTRKQDRIARWLGADVFIYLLAGLFAISDRVRDNAAVARRKRAALRAREQERPLVKSVAK